MHDIHESNQPARRGTPASKRERLYFWLLLLSSVVTGCGVAVLLLALGVVGLIVLGIALLVISLLLIRKSIKVRVLRSEQIRLSEEQFGELYHRVHRQAKQIGLWRMPATFLIDDARLTAPRLLWIFQTYLLLIPASYQKHDEAHDFLLLRELAHIKQNHNEKRVLLLLGSWIPFLRFAYLRACEETADRMAIQCMESQDAAVRGIFYSTLGPTVTSQVNEGQYITEKQHAATFLTEVSNVFRTRPSILRRLAATGKYPRDVRQTRRNGWMLGGLAGSVSLVAITALLFVGGQVPQLLSDLTTFIDEEVASEQDLGETKLMAAIQKGTLEEVEQLLPDGDMEAVDADGDTALHYLGYRKSSKGLETIFEALLAAGSDLDAVNEFGERPFITAVYSNNKELVALYLKQGEKIDQQDDDGYTPLHHAVEGEGKETVKLLLEQGADPAIKNDDGYTPLMLAEEYELDDIIVLLKQNMTQTL
ncbi:ankyrin repeat domain-containing protein [Exiguobacterium sp. s193]|uniref:ankyrin repeat domain-containing protein n=1 Tax=Exiguobacterium sp. s193 TaxID=2751207 RepID=UPI001BE74D00|nr:ankyrin repeat domain-containing protein [Exiguobacterium sp. s193]